MAVGVGAAATLLLAAWVSAAGPVGVFARKDFSGKESGTPGKDFGSVAIPPRRGNGLKGADVRHPDPWVVSLVEQFVEVGGNDVAGT